MRRSREISLPILGCGVLVAFYAWLLASAWRRGMVPQDVATYNFSCFWAAGRLALAGRAVAAYEWANLRDVLEAALHLRIAPENAFPWFYPPPFFLAMAPLAALPYAAAAAIWGGAALGVYLVGMWAILPGGATLVAALAAPAAFLNLWIGETALLATGLLAGGLALLDERPLFSGALLGCLAYKPQLGILLPLFLAATRRWRVFAAASVTVAALAGTAGTIFGWEAYTAFARSLALAGDVFLSHRGNALGLYTDWGEVQSVYGLLHALGAPGAVAWTGHVVVAVAAVAASLCIAAEGRFPALAAAALTVAAVLATPYCEIADLALLTPAMAFLVRDGLARGSAWWERPVLAVAFLSPIGFVATLGMRAVGLGPLMSALLLAVVLVRWRRGRAQASSASSNPAVSATTNSGRRFTSS